MRNTLTGSSTCTPVAEVRTKSRTKYLAGDLAIHRLKGTFPQDLVNRFRRILIPLDDNLHGLGLLVVIGIIDALHEHLTIIDLVRQHTIQKPL